MWCQNGGGCWGGVCWGGGGGGATYLFLAILSRHDHCACTYLKSEGAFCFICMTVSTISWAGCLLFCEFICSDLLRKITTNKSYGRIACMSTGYAARSSANLIVSGALIFTFGEVKRLSLSLTLLRASEACQLAPILPALVSGFPTDPVLVGLAICLRHARNMHEYSSPTCCHEVLFLRSVFFWSLLLKPTLLKGFFFNPSLNVSYVVHVKHMSTYSTYWCHIDFQVG